MTCLRFSIISDLSKKYYSFCAAVFTAGLPTAFDAWVIFMLFLFEKYSTAYLHPKWVNENMWVPQFSYFYLILLGSFSAQKSFLH